MTVRGGRKHFNHGSTRMHTDGDESPTMQPTRKPFPLLTGGEGRDEGEHHFDSSGMESIASSMP